MRETNEVEEIFERDNEDETVAADADDERSQLSDKTLAKSKIKGAATEAVMEEMNFL